MGTAAHLEVKYVYISAYGAFEANGKVLFQFGISACSSSPITPPDWYLLLCPVYSESFPII